MKSIAWFFQKYLTRFEHMNPSYAQEGEDLILMDLFERKTSGFYVDIGAHHPKRFSNTYLFYLRGWSGINVDPLIGESSLFQKQRPRDINLPVGVSAEPGELEYFQFNEPALNTFSRERRDLLVRSHSKDYPLIGSKKIKTYPLRDLLDRYLPQGREIDFLSIDVEGLDQEVLLSNDWRKYRPDVLLVEETSSSQNAQDASGTKNQVLLDLGYVFRARTVRTLIFTRSHR